MLAYSNSFGTNQAEAKAAVESAISIVHVHGQLGALTLDGRSEKERRYEPARTRATVKTAAGGIRVLSEAVATSEEFRTAGGMLHTAKRRIFLGCAYHEENMIRIKLPELLSLEDESRPEFCGSAYGLTDREKTVVSSRWQIQLGRREAMTLDFLRETIDW